MESGRKILSFGIFLAFIGGMLDVSWYQGYLQDYADFALLEAKTY